MAFGFLRIVLITFSVELIDQGFLCINFRQKVLVLVRALGFQEIQGTKKKKKRTSENAVWYPLGLFILLIFGLCGYVGLLSCVLMIFKDRKKTQSGGVSYIHNRALSSFLDCVYEFYFGRNKRSLNSGRRFILFFKLLLFSFHPFQN